MVPGASRVRWWAVVLFALAASVRLFRVDWDQHHFFHPDERAVGFALERLSFSPLQLNPHFFAYGSFPLYIIKCATALLGNFSPKLRSYDGSIFTGRAISALWGAATVLLLAFLGARLYGRRVGLLAGFLMAATVLHVQNSHFATSDVPLTFLVLLALFFLVRVVESGRLRDYLAAGFSTGLAVATKFSALPILLPIGIAVLYRWIVEGRRFRALGYGAAALILLAFGFALGQPYAILDFHAFRSDILEQSRMVRHAGLFPYTNQYIGVPKYLYDLEQMILWGMGPALGLAAVAGTLLCCLETIRKRRMAEVVLLAWFVPFFAITGSFDVKFPRYLLPVYTLLILWGAAALAAWAARGWIGKVVTGAVLVVTLAWLAAFLRIYTRPHTVVAASEWFYRQVPSGTKVVSQHWDEGFPFPLPGDRNPDRYRIVDLPYYEPDTPDKMNKISTELASAEYAVFQTKRIYGAVTRAPEKFPLTNRYFYRLFAGDLGFTLTKDFASRPTLLGVEIPDELADESFSVYDHPKVLVFRNTAHLPAPLLDRRILSGAASRPLTRRELLLASAERFPAVASIAQGTAAGTAPLLGALKQTSSVGKLEQPRGIALNRAGHLFVCDFGHDRIQEFDGSLKPVSAWGGTGKGPREFSQPVAIAVGPEEQLYVADTWNGRVQEFDAAGVFRREWRSDFFGPRGIAVAPEGKVLVADTGNHRIVRFSAEGNKELEWGGRGAEPGKLLEPVGLAVASDGRVFVCDNGNGRMQIFDRDGKPWKAFTVPGWRREVFSEPQVALDREGTPWVTVPLEREVRHYSADGKLLKTIPGDVLGDAGFDRPMGIAVDSSGGVVFVSDLAGRLVRLPVAAR